MWAGTAQSVEGLATGWRVRGSNPGWGETVRTRPDCHGAHPSSCTVGISSLSWEWSGRREALTTHPDRTQTLKKEYSNTSSSPLGLLFYRIQECW